MPLALIALLAAAALWILAMRQPRGLGRADVRRVEFWWTVSVFASGIIFPSLTIASVGTLGSADSDVALRLAPMLLLGIIAVLRSLHAGARISISALWILLTFGVLAAQSLQTPSPIVWLSFLLFLPGIVTPSRGYDLQAIKDGGRIGLTVGLIAMMAVAAANAPLVLGYCRLDKCSIWGEALGPSGTGNALGLVLAASAAVSLIMAPSPLKFGLILVSSYVLVDLSSSRSALYSWAAAVAITLAYHLSRRRGKLFFVMVASAGAGVLTALFTFLGWTGLDFTERGALWLYAQGLIADRPWFGYGSSFWVRGSNTDGVQLNYSTHNLFLEMLVSVGIVGVATTLFAIIAACRGRKQLESSLFTTALVGIFFVMSITEVFSAPGRPYIMAGFVVTIFVAGEAVSARISRSTVEIGGGLFGAHKVPRVTP